MQLRKLAGAALFLTALGSDAVADDLRRELAHHGLTVHAACRDRPHRRGFAHVDARTGERTITIMGERIVPTGADPLPWDDLARLDAVYFTAGDAAALRHARRAPVLVVAVRAYETLRAANVEVDAVVASADDATEQYDLGRIRPAPRHVIRTEGARGGGYATAGGAIGRWAATDPPGPVLDAYGCGDAFAAGLTYALSARQDLAEALALGATCGAHVLTGLGPYEGQYAPAPGPDPETEAEAAEPQPPSARRSAS